MMVKSAMAALTVFLVWLGLDYVLHGLILSSFYAAAGPHLFRPMAEVKMGPMYAVLFIHAVAFVATYALLVEHKRVGKGLLYGILYGIGAGIGMGYGTYLVMPIPHELALGWFLGTVLETSVAGLAVGVIVSPPGFSRLA